MTIANVYYSRLKSAMTENVATYAASASAWPATCTHSRTIPSYPITNNNILSPLIRPTTKLEPLKSKRLWKNTKPVLSEMDIKGKGRFNLKPFHKGKAGAVCKRKVFIIIFTKDIPSSFPINKGDRFYVEKDIGFEGITQFDCSFAAYGSEKEIKGFNKNQIGCHQVTSLEDEISVELAGYL